MVSIARDMNPSVDTVESWLTDPDNARFLDEIVSLYRSRWKRSCVELLTSRWASIREHEPPMSYERVSSYWRLQAYEQATLLARSRSKRSCQRQST